MSEPGSPKRHLPVLPSQPEPSPGAGMSPGRWVILGLLPVYLLWVPLAGLTAALTKRLLGDTSPDQLGLGLKLGIALAQVASFKLAAVAGGFLITWLGERTRIQDAARCGALAAGLAWFLAWLRSDLGALALPLFVVVTVLGAGAGAFGGWLGRRRR